MSEAKHTPGPWHVGAYEDVYVAGEVAPVAEVRKCRTVAECHANAHLIAAAPELLEALEELVSEAEQTAFEAWVERTTPRGDADFVQHQWERSYDRDDFLGLYEKQIAAIAKAKGDTPC